MKKSGIVLACPGLFLFITDYTENMDSTDLDKLNSFGETIYTWKKRKTEKSQADRSIVQ
jgi:hypothetical protein